MRFVRVVLSRCFCLMIAAALCVFMPQDAYATGDFTCQTEQQKGSVLSIDLSAVTGHFGADLSVALMDFSVTVNTSDQVLPAALSTQHLDSSNVAHTWFYDDDVRLLFSNDGLALRIEVRDTGKRDGIYTGHWYTTYTWSADDSPSGYKTLSLQGLISCQIY